MLFLIPVFLALMMSIQHAAGVGLVPCYVSLHKRVIFILDIGPIIFPAYDSWRVGV